MAKTETPPAEKAVTEDALKPVVEKLASVVTVKETHELRLTVPTGFHRAFREMEIEVDGRMKPPGKAEVKAAMGRLLEAAAAKEDRVPHKLVIVEDNDKGEVRATCKLVSKAEKKELDAAEEEEREKESAKRLAHLKPNKVPA